MIGLWAYLAGAAVTLLSCCYSLAADVGFEGRRIGVVIATLFWPLFWMGFVYFVLSNRRPWDAW